MNLRDKSDVLIIGGGVIGLGLARELRKKSAGKITVVERGELGREASYAAAGMLAPQAETDCEDEFYRFCSESNDLYPEFAGQLLDETGIDIELDRSGTLYLAFNEGDSADIRKRYDWQKEAGMAVEHLTAEETRKAEPFVSPDVRGSLYFPGDGQVENRKLMQALRLYAETERDRDQRRHRSNGIVDGRSGGYGRVDDARHAFSRNSSACNRRVDFAHPIGAGCGSRKDQADQRPDDNFPDG